MTSGTRNWLLAALVPLILVLLMFVVWVARSNRTPSSFPALPSPNGYDDLVKAAQMLATNNTDFNALNEPALQTLVENNSNALQLARSALARPCRVPVQFSVAYNSSHQNEYASLKKLAQAFAGEGRLAEMQGRLADAAQSYLDAYHMGNEAARGGLLMDKLVGVAIESYGISRLQNIATQLDANNCRLAASNLQTLASQRQTWEQVLRQENEWSRRTFPEYQYQLARLMSYRLRAREHQQAEQRSKRHEGETQQLIIDLASRAYRLENGKSPGNMAALVPGYLKTIPIDPYTGKPMTYILSQ